MADPMANAHAFYDAQHDHIVDLFDRDEWEELQPILDEALQNPRLPRYHRCKYHSVAALREGVTLEEAREHVALAKESIEDMRK